MPASGSQEPVIVPVSAKARTSPAVRPALIAIVAPAMWVSSASDRVSSGSTAAVAACSV
jgi:hypothetical protein